MMQTMQRGKKTFFKNVSYLTIGQGINILFRYLTFSFIIRGIDVHQYGQFITVISYCGFFQILTLPGITKPLVRSACREPEELDSILSSKSNLRNILAMIAIVCANIAVGFFGYSQNVVFLIRVFSLSIFLDSLIVYIRIVFKVHENFKWISVSDVLQTISYFVLAILSLKFSLGINFLVYSFLASTLLSFFFDYYNSRKYSKFSLFGKMQLDSIFFKSALIFTFTNVMWQIITRIDIIMLSIIGTDTDVGVFNVANRIVFFGIMGISIVSNVLYPPIVKKLAKGTIEFSKNKIMFFTGLSFGFILCLFLFTYSETIIQIIAGTNYSQSANILKILSAFFFLKIIISPLLLILNAKDREYSLFLVVLPLPIIKIILNYFLFSFIGLEGIAITTVVVYLVFLILLLFFNWKIIRKAFN